MFSPYGKEGYEVAFGQDRSFHEDPPVEDDIVASASDIHYDGIELRWPNATVPFLFRSTLGE